MQSISQNQYINYREHGLSGESQRAKKDETDSTEALKVLVNGAKKILKQGKVSIIFGSK